MMITLEKKNKNTRLIRGSQDPNRDPNREGWSERITDRSVIRDTTTIYW